MTIKRKLEIVQKRGLAADALVKLEQANPKLLDWLAESISIVREGAELPFNRELLDALLTGGKVALTHYKQSLEQVLEMKEHE